MLPESARQLRHTALSNIRETVVSYALNLARNENKKRKQQKHLLKQARHPSPVKGPPFLAV